MKYREKGELLEVEVRNRQGVRTFHFKLIDYRPRPHNEVCPCTFCPFENDCSVFPDPRNLGDPDSDFNNFCADLDKRFKNKTENGRWVPIPTPEEIDEWLSGIVPPEDFK